MAFDLSMPILVVDDYATMIRIIRNLLKQLGFENVDDATDGSAALAKMQAKKYGLVISDWNMEPMTGYDLLREVRASPELSKTPFIMITAESKTENVIAAKKAGVSNYIVKPFNAATLKTKMEAVFGPAEQCPSSPDQHSGRSAPSGRFVFQLAFAARSGSWRAGLPRRTPPAARSPRSCTEAKIYEGVRAGRQTSSCCREPRSGWQGDDEFMRNELLVIEDADVHLSILRKIATQAGFNTTGVSSVDAASTILRTRHFDCVTLDLSLGERSGTEVLQRLAELKYRGPVLIISASENDRLDASVRIGNFLELNVCPPFSKPINLPLLRQTLKQIASETDRQKLVRRQAGRG